MPNLDRRLPTPPRRATVNPGPSRGCWRRGDERTLTVRILAPPALSLPRASSVAGYLTKGEIARLTEEVKNLEKDTGIRLRVLAQAYPNTPGLAVKDYWAVDDNTVVFVADPGLGNILNFSVGADIDLEVRCAVV